MAELDDDREDIEPETSDEDAGDPAAAFDALRRTIETQGAHAVAELTVMRRGLEAAFDQLDKIEPPQDYKPQLAQLVQALDSVAARLAGVEQSPVLRQGAEHYARVIERSGEGLVRTAVQQFERQAADLERAGRNLAAYVLSARERNRQDWWLSGVGIAGLVVGIVFMLVVSATLPGSVAPRVAGFVMGQGPWDAGKSLMEYGDADAAKRVWASDQLINANKATVAACWEAAVKAGKDQKCTITVAAPAK